MPGVMPTAGEIAAELSATEKETVDALERLAAGRVIVLEPGDHRRVRMANPFSAAPTPFAVECAGKSWWGNCIWDSLGIPAALGADAVINCECGDCGEAMQVEVRGRQLEGEGIIHFGIPARSWWDDIIHT